MHGDGRAVVPRLPSELHSIAGPLSAHPAWPFSIAAAARSGRTSNRHGDAPRLVPVAPYRLPEVEPRFGGVRLLDGARIRKIHQPVHAGVMARPLRPAVTVRIAGLAKGHPVGPCQVG